MQRRPHSNERTRRIRHAAKASASLLTHALQGAGFAAVMLALALAFAGEWNDTTNVTARIIFLAVLVSAGGAAFYATDSFRRQAGWRTVAANVQSVLAYCVAVLAAFVLGMNGPD